MHSYTTIKGTCAGMKKGLEFTSIKDLTRQKSGSPSLVYSSYQLLVGRIPTDYEGYRPTMYIIGDLTPMSSALGG